MPRGRRDVDAVLLTALACGATVEVAAQKAGVSVSTVHRRLKHPGFKQNLRHAQGEMVHRTAGTLTAAATEAVRALLDLLKTGTPTVRLGAARTILEVGAKLRESADLEERVAEIEQRLDQKSSSQGSRQARHGGDVR
jgi:hypothetical protein